MSSHEPRIITTTNHDSKLAHLVSSSIDSAIAATTGKLPEDLLALEGMSGIKYRLFINKLVEDVPDARYLEIGSWGGSTLCSAIYKNKVRALAIDNWSQFGGPSNTFFKNLGSYSSSESAVSFLNADFRAVSYASVGKFNIYLFDGPHEKQDHYDALEFVKPALETECIFIVDDWNWNSVRDGTLEAIEKTGAKIAYSTEIFSTNRENTHPADIGLPAAQYSDWHNGYFLSVLKF